MQSYCKCVCVCVCACVHASMCVCLCCVCALVCVVCVVCVLCVLLFSCHAALTIAFFLISHFVVKCIFSYIFIEEIVYYICVCV